MKLTDYNISFWDSIKYTRHILLDKKTLCNSEIYTIGTIRHDLELEYFDLIHDLCSECMEKLPKELLEKIKFNYIVRKLKNDI